MQAQNADSSRMRAVTISRQYGSGGGEVANRLAKRLGWQLVDHEIVLHTARELNISEAEAEEWDESSESLVSQMLNNMRLLYPATLTVPAEKFVVTDTQTYHEALLRVVQAAVKTGHVVIVGRGSQVLLKDQRDVLHVRIVANLEKRIAYVMQREELSQVEAQKRIQLKDTDRERYLQNQYRSNTNDPCLYDMMLNTSILSLDATVDLIEAALTHKAERLSVPEEALGPGVGLTPYPGLPGDIRPPTSS